MVEDILTELFEEKDIEFIINSNKNEIEVHLEPNIYTIKLRINEGVILPAIDFVNTNVEDQLLSYILERNYKGTIILWGFLTHALCEKGILAYYNVNDDIFHIQKDNFHYTIKASMEGFVFNEERS